jgi:dCMP deaminase
MSELRILRRAVDFGMHRSGDPRTRVGAAVKFGSDPLDVIFGANRLPEGVEVNDARASPQHKARYIEHAERDVLYACAREGIKTKGAIMYAPWFACCHCARAIIAAGIREVVGLRKLRNLTSARWSDEIAAAHQMLEEAGVEMWWVASDLGTTILFDGKEIEI